MPNEHLKRFEQYIESWKTKNLTAFLTTLAENVTITECYGATYVGKDEAEKWFQDWTKPADNQVIDWDILSFFEDSDKQTAFFNWRFHYRYQGQTAIFDGISQVTFSANYQMTDLKEYKMTYNKFRPYLKEKERDDH